MGGITDAIRRRLLKGDVAEVSTVKEVAGTAYEPYVYSKPIYHDGMAIRDVRDKRGNHIRTEYLEGFLDKGNRTVMFEEFSTPAGAEGAMLDKWGISSELFLTGRTKGYLGYIDESRSWARWFSWPDGFPLKAWRQERFSWNLVSEDADGLLDDVIEESDPCPHNSYSGVKLGFCDDCGAWILDSLDERPQDERKSSLYSWRSL